jgi:hypothetical protein
MRFCLRGVGCDAPCFELASLVLMTEQTGSNPLTLVKPWSTWVITSKTESTAPNDPLDQDAHTGGQSLVKPRCPWTSSGTFAAFSKFHLNTSKSPNIKVVQFFEGHNFAFGWHCKFGVGNSEKLGQLQETLLISAMKIPNLAPRSCSNRWSKRLSAFVKVVEGSLIFNFAIHTLVADTHGHVAAVAPRRPGPGPVPAARPEARMPRPHAPRAALEPAPSRATSLRAAPDPAHAVRRRHAVCVLPWSGPPARPSLLRGRASAPPRAARRP